MKNIFSKLSVKRVAGAVLAGATLMVGLGVVNNFNSGSQKAANEAALSNFGESAYNNFISRGSANRADLEMQMSAGQGRYSARFLKGKSDGTESGDAFSSDGAYAEGVRSDEGFVYGPDESNSAYQPFGSTYEQGTGGVEFDAAGQDLAYGEGRFNEAQAAAADAVAGMAGKGETNGKDGKNGQNGKGANGKAAGATGQVRPATQINKLASSSGSSTFGGVGGTGGGVRNGGSSTSFATGSTTGGGDNNTRALPQANVAQPDAGAFKFGRAGSMGGINVSFSGGEAKGGRSKGTGAASDLQMAAIYSGKALATRQESGSKSLAEAAFDGSNPEELTPTVAEGATIDKVANSLLDANGMGDLPEALKPPLEEIPPILDEIAQQQAELTALQKKINQQLALLIGATLIAAIALYFLVKAAYAATVAWPLWLAAVVLSAGALAFIAYMMWNKNGIVELIKQMGDKDKFGLVNEGIDIKEKLTYSYLIAGGLTVVLGLCWVPWSKVGTWLNSLGSGSGTGAGKSVDLLNTPAKRLFKVDLPKSKLWQPPTKLPFKFPF